MIEWNKKITAKFLLLSSIQLCVVSCQTDVWKYVDFDQSMKLAQFPRAIKASEQIYGKEGLGYYEFFKNVYNQNNLTELRKKGIVLGEKIPKIIHQIWIGGLLPEAFKDLCESWKFYHNSRGWFYKLWTDEDVPKMELYNQRFFDQTTSPGVRSDLMKWEIIYNFGGFYLDVDFECLQPLDDLRGYDFVTALQPLDAIFVQLGAAFYGARPGHPILEHCIKTVKDDWHHKGAPKRTGPVHYTKSFVAVAGQAGSLDVALPASYFYPLGAQEKKFDFERYQEWIDGGAYGVHHWAKSWMPARFRLEQFQLLDNDNTTEDWND